MKVRRLIAAAPTPRGERNFPSRFRLSSPLCLGMLVALALVSCRERPKVAAEPSPSTNLQTFEVTGVVQSVDLRQSEVTIKHQAVVGYMPAMTMPFDVKDTNELTGLSPGEPVTFRLNVTAMEGWIDQIQKWGPPMTNDPQASAPVRLARDVEPLEVGDPLPEYQFIDQFGRPVSTAQFKGQALAITFLFTRCPYPNFCPRMANNFEKTQKKMLAAKQSATRWHLLTISFDPEFDTPPVLKAYAEAHHYQPEHWTFATGRLIDITAIAEQFGLAFWHDQTGSISHTLRTAVISPSGRLQKVFDGNNWTSDELVAELVKASKSQF